MNREIKNAVIESTMLGLEDHGIFTFFLHLKFPPGGQGFGGYCLDEYRKELEDRRGTAYGMEFIRQVCGLFEKDWEKLPGTPCRVDGDWGKIYRIGHYIEDKWVDPEKLRVEYFGEKERQI